MNEEYNLGYFEGVRNVFMSWSTLMNMHLDQDDAIQAFMRWLADEFADAKKLKDESTTCSCDGTIHHIDECGGDE